MKPLALSNQIIFIGLRSSKDYYKRPGGGVGIWEGLLGCEFLLGWMCVEGMGCGRRWVRWVLRGTGTASGHPLGNNMCNLLDYPSNLAF